MEKWRYIEIRNSSYDLYKVFIALCLTIYFCWIILNPNEWNFLQNVNLIFHEAGHFIMIFFGEFLTTAGGTIFQILIPIVCCLYFFLKQEYFSASLLAFWIGQSFIGVSIYARDAIVMQLPLLGGDTSGHDWHNMLSSMNILNSASTVANIFYGIGVMIIIFASIFSFANSRAYSFINKEE